MEKKQSVRIQTSVLNQYEKKVLQAIVRRLPSFTTSDQLTVVGVVGAVMITIGYALTNLSPAWLWLANLGFLVNWFGDSLDGTLARYRNQQRPVYGFYIDHNLDCLCAFLMVLGAGLSAYMSLWSALLIIAPYLMLDVFVMINAHLKNEFRLTFAKLGPTELPSSLSWSMPCSSSPLPCASGRTPSRSWATPLRSVRSTSQASSSVPVSWLSIS